MRTLREAIANCEVCLVAEQRLYSTDDLSEVNLFKGTGIRVPSQEHSMTFNPVNAMADKQSILSVHDDIVDLKSISMLHFKDITFMKRRSHALGIHDRGHDFLQDQFMNSVW